MSRKNQFHVLVVNDDGIHAPGLHALLRKLLHAYPRCDAKDDGVRKVNIYVSCPEREMSATSHSVTVRNPVFVESLELPGELSVLKAYAISGTPVDCVRMAICTNIFSGGESSSHDAHDKAVYKFKFTPDLVLSGINRGNNAGLNVIYSGTVAGAREAVIMGFPSIALSLDHAPTYPSDQDKWDYNMAADLSIPVINNMLDSIEKKEVPQNFFLNVNIPNVDNVSQIQGVKLTRQSMETKWIEAYTEVTRSVGYRREFLLTGIPVSEPDVNSDGGALAKNYVSVTPLHLSSSVLESPFLPIMKGWSLFGK
eukprot:TRINITY_DN8394_c0_g1_i4.p2 TRINITY_DN8394_c0_g1~~TRINITY_DN8394_c0_g1_i4.p2  ORF type:complete len:310 (-),score=51.18 TRINITY_DN8394_c0_g1_i4:39-968(-)